jgi:amidohydrolase
MALENVASIASGLEGELTELRRSLHAHPELSWKEVETSKLIEAKLRALGFQNIRRGFKGTESGVVADLKGGKSGPCIALRADIDALPIREENNIPYVSKVDGVMHACGHDAHATILIGAATILSRMKADIAGTVRVIFQPAEEAGNDSGAPAMIKEGALEGVDAIAGLHVWSQLTAGMFGLRKGPAMASADVWEMVIQGQGGHGAMPHNAIDPTVALAHIISMMQTVVSREIDPLESAVVSVGKVEAGMAPNVIPDKAVITGNIRTTSRKTREGMEARIRRIIDGVSAALRCTTTLKYTPIYPVTINDPDMTVMMGDVAAKVFGKDKVVELPIAMGSEDFSYYGEKIPAVFGFLGMADPEKGSDRQHHSPHFNSNDAVLVHGAEMMAGMALEYLSGKK